MDERGEDESDEALVERVRRGNVALFTVLVQRHNRSLYRVARAIVKDDHEAEDIVQQAHVSAYVHLDQFEGRAKFSTWIGRIATHEALARRRSRLLVPPAARSESGESDGVEERDPEDLAARSELTRTLEAAIEELPAHYRAAFVLRHVEGLDTSDAAAWLGVSEQTLRVRLHRARLLLRAKVLGRVPGGTEELFSFGGARCARVTRGVLSMLAAMGRS